MASLFKRLSEIQVRPWGPFIESESLGAPSNGDELASRVKHNFKYYAGNYLLIAGFILAVTVYFTPALVVVIATSVGTGVGLFLQPSLVVSGHRVVDTEKLAVVLILSVIIVWLTETSNVIYTAFFFTSIITITHSALRKKSLKGSVSNFVDTAGLTSGVKQAKDTLRKVGEDFQKNLDD